MSYHRVSISFTLFIIQTYALRHINFRTPVCGNGGGGEFWEHGPIIMEPITCSKLQCAAWCLASQECASFNYWLGKLNAPISGLYLLMLLACC